MVFREKMAARDGRYVYIEGVGVHTLVQSRGGPRRSRRIQIGEGRVQILVRGREIAARGTTLQGFDS